MKTLMFFFFFNSFHYIVCTIHKNKNSLNPDQFILYVYIYERCSKWGSSLLGYDFQAQGAIKTMAIMTETKQT